MHEVTRNQAAFSDDLQHVVERVQRYGKHMLDVPFTSPVSFFRADLVENWQQIDIALMGIPSDAGLTHRPGARYAPQAMRAQSGLIRYINPMTHIIPYELARIGDIGDVPIASTLQPDLIMQEIWQFYQSIHAAGLIPVTAGGDHSITYPILRALASKRPLGLIYIDSHHDTSAPLFGSTYHHASSIYHSLNEGLIDPRRSIQIAIRDPYFEMAPLAYTSGMTIIDIGQLQQIGVPAVIERARQVVGDEPVYLSFDIDALDPAFAPGTGAPVVGGLTSREAMQLLQGLRGLDIIGGDVVEVSPPYDPTGVTALVGAQMLFEILCLTAEAYARRNNPALMT